MLTENPHVLTGSGGVRQEPAAVKSKFDLIQVFRGFAAMLVVGYHCNKASIDSFKLLPFKGLFYPGMFGVDFFFVLSGFIITYIHLADVQNKGSWKLFLKKRFFRIYPIYWIFAAVTLIYVVLVEKGQPDLYGHPLQRSSGADWLYIIKSFALFPQPQVALVDVSWTLCFEVLFYLVFAIAIISGWRIARIIFFSWALMIGLKTMFWPGATNFYTDFLLSPLITEFLAGCALAYVIRKQSVKLTPALFLVLAGLLAGGAFIYLKIFHRSLGRDAIDLLLIISSAVLIIWASIAIDRFNRVPARKIKTLLLIGDGSYSIYLTHTLVIKLLFSLAVKLVLLYAIAMNTLYINILFAAVAVVAIAIGCLFHLYVERGLLVYLNRKFLPGKRPPVMAVDQA